MNNEDLLRAFTTGMGCNGVLENLLKALQNVDPAVIVIALEGLYRVEGDVKSNQFPKFLLGFPQNSLTKNIRDCLRKWRCESPLCQAYSGAFYRVPTFLRSLTIFKTFEVPLFIDDYGGKKLLSWYQDKIEDIHINGETPIFHVTHSEEAKKIREEGKFNPSDNKNIIKGVWFGLDNSQNSVYGSKRFETTLSKLGVTGLHQGEIVAYKNEVNVILYAADDAKFEGLKKPTDGAVREANPMAYVQLSIFVPSRFFIQKKFSEVFGEPTEVKHSPFCVRASRSAESHFDYFNCHELNNDE